MPDLGIYHPQVVHFVVGLLFVGVLLRAASFSRRFPFAGRAALLLILLGTAAAVLAVESGDDAHPAAERIPGVRPVVEEHEEWGERTRNLFLGVAALELLALWAGRRGRERPVLMASLLLGLIGLGSLVETAEEGGRLVYSYGGGIGTRSGDAEDVTRLLIAGLYQQAQADRRAGHRVEAARLIQEMAARRPDDLSVRLMLVESQWRDQGDPAGALQALAHLALPSENHRIVYQAGLLKADLLAASGSTTAARATLEKLLEKFPDNRRLQQRLDSLESPGRE